MRVDCDVLVIGGGGGGLVAALSARAGGAEVMLAEKWPRLGGNTALSSGTQGGLLVDAKARVLHHYAAGGTAVGVSGSDGGRGYCSANGLLAALGLGRIAGRDAAEAL
jgi:NADPH-dependent 2,4-dienoyl-CoA reductase/sulfur reductase-like enzyme